MATVEDMIEQIKSLQLQNDVRSQETQTLQKELKQEEANRIKEVQSITAGYQGDINKLKNDIIEMMKKQQQEEQYSLPPLYKT